jgi:medium-chain acyl-[acyl-carrier-protein] hydrolase
VNSAPIHLLEFFRPRSSAAVRLVCLPFAGGSATLYRTWQSMLPDFIEVWPVELPGRGKRLAIPPFRCMSSLIAALESEVLYKLDSSFALFGHSMGSLIAFELARSAESKLGISPVHLFIAGRRAPYLPRFGRLTYALPDDEFVAELRRMRGTPEALLDDRTALQLFLPMLRADFELVQTYKFVDAAPLTCPVTVLGGVHDQTTPKRDLEGWMTQTTGRCSIRMVRGDHFFLSDSQEDILTIVAQELSATRKSTGFTSRREK